MLEYNPSYAKSVGTNEFYFPDTSRSAESKKYTRRFVTHRQNVAGNADDRGLMIDDVDEITTKVLLPEKYFWEHLLK